MKNKIQNILYSRSKIMFIIDDLIAMGYGATMLAGAELGKVERNLGLTPSYNNCNKIVEKSKPTIEKSTSKSNFNDYVKMITDRCKKASEIEDRYMRNLELSLIKDEIRRLEFRKEITADERKLLNSLVA